MISLHKMQHLIILRNNKKKKQQTARLVGSYILKYIAS